MTQAEVIQALREYIAKDPAANALFHSFAVRQRTRRTVFLRTLHKKMTDEGYAHPREAYAAVLKQMATLGIGRLILNNKGRVVGLDSIQMTLQSLGAAVCSEGLSVGALTKAKTRNKYRKVFPIQGGKTTPKADEVPISASLTVFINGKPLTIAVPEEFDVQEISTLVSRFRAKELRQ